MHSIKRFVFILLISVNSLGMFLHADAHAPPSPTTIHEAPSKLAVRRELPTPSRGIVEFKFNEIFKMPIGPRGLEPSKKLKAVNGKQVRVVGFMVQQKSNMGSFLLSPLPIAVGAEDESLADDLPAGLIRVDLDESPSVMIPHIPGLLQITGTLHIKNQMDAKQDRISFVQLLPDQDTRRALLSTTDPGQTTSDKH